MATRAEGLLVWEDDASPELLVVLLEHSLPVLHPGSFVGWTHVALSCGHPAVKTSCMKTSEKRNLLRTLPPVTDLCICITVVRFEIWEVLLLPIEVERLTICIHDAWIKHECLNEECFHVSKSIFASVFLRGTNDNIKKRYFSKKAPVSRKLLYLKPILHASEGLIIRIYVDLYQENVMSVQPRHNKIWRFQFDSRL